MDFVPNSNFSFVTLFTNEVKRMLKARIAHRFLAINQLAFFMSINLPLGLDTSLRGIVIVSTPFLI